jgi:myosin heavy subunit
LFSQKERLRENLLRQKLPLLCDYFQKSIIPQYNLYRKFQDEQRAFVRFLSFMSQELFRLPSTNSSPQITPPFQMSLESMKSVLNIVKQKFETEPSALVHFRAEHAPHLQDVFTFLCEHFGSQFTEEFGNFEAVIQEIAQSRSLSKSIHPNFSSTLSTLLTRLDTYNNTPQRPSNAQHGSDFSNSEPNPSFQQPIQAAISDSDYAQQQSQLLQLQQEMQILQNKNQDQANQIAQLQSEKQFAHTNPPKIDDLKTLQDHIMNLSSANKSLQHDIKQLQSAKNKLIRVHQTLQKEMQERESESNNLTKENQTHQGKIQEQQNENDNLQRENQTLQSTIEAQRDQITQLQTENQNLESEIKTLQEQSIQQQDQIK